MLIEHWFVTTRPPADVLAEAGILLANHGFTADATAAFSVDPALQNRLQMRRGEKKRRKMKDATQFPQRVLLEWDRGRVNVAASIEPRATSTSFTIRGGLLRDSFARLGKKESALCAEMLTAVVQAVEARIVDGAEETEAARPWMQVEPRVRAFYRRKRRRATITAIVIFLLIVGSIVAIAVTANQHR